MARRGAEFSNIRSESLVFSPNSQRVAYATRESGKWAVVVDDSTGKQYDRIDRSGPVFSPDSDKVAYVASIGTNSYIVVNGNEQGFDGRELRFGQLAFSLDSQSVVFGARRGEDWVVTAGGVQERLGEHVKKSRIEFVTENRFHFLTLKDGEFFRVVGRDLLRLAGPASVADRACV